MALPVRRITLSHLQQTALYALGLIIMKMVSLVMLPFITRHLAPVDYGRLELIITVLNFGSIVLAFGLAEAMYRFHGMAANADDEKLAISTLFGTSVFLCIATLLLTPFLSHSIPLYVNQISAQEIQLAWATLSIGTLINLPLAYMRSRDAAISFFIATTGRAIIQAFLTYWFVSQGESVAGVLKSSFISTLVCAAGLSMWFYAKVSIHFSVRLMLKFMAYGIPFVGSGLAAFVLVGMDTWSIGYFLNSSAVAQYALAAKFYLITSFLIQPFGMWWYPRRLKLLNQPNGLAQNATYSVFGSELGFLMACWMAALGPVLILNYLPSQYHDCVAYIPWLALIAAIKNAAELLNVGCFIQSNSRLQLRIELQCAALAFSGYLFAVPHFGVAGALISLVLVHVIRLGMFFYYSQKHLHLNYRLSACVALAVLFLLSAYNKWSGPYGMEIDSLVVAIAFSLYLTNKASRLHHSAVACGKNQSTAQPST